MVTDKILIVDDEETLCEVLKLNLEIEGYEVDVAYSAEEALAKDLKMYSLILLDIMMGGISGIKMARMLKADVATANMKPYTVRNVIARVKTVLRRTQGNKATATVENRLLEIEGLVLDLEFKRCSVDGQEVKLTRKEFELLAYLIRHKGKICSREQILSSVWSDEVVVLDRTIDVNINRLRSKIGKYGSYIVTRSGFGYGFRD